MKQLAQRILLALFGVALAASILELSLSHFYIKTDFFGFTLSARSWWERNWHPLTDLQFRDETWSAERLANKKIALVLGDSVVAGHGIDDYRDRFTNLLNSKLGSNWAVLNAGICGLDTSAETRLLKNQLAGMKVDWLILTYYPNDFEAVSGVALAAPHIPDGFWGYLVEHSHLASFIYWRVFRYLKQDDYQSYWEKLKLAARDSEIWNKHEQEISGLVSEARRHASRVTAVLVPALLADEFSNLVLDRVSRKFTALGLDPVDIRNSFADFSAEDLVVSSQDPHPNRLAHELIASAVLKKSSE